MEYWNPTPLLFILFYYHRLSRYLYLSISNILIFGIPPLNNQSLSSSEYIGRGTGMWSILIVISIYSNDMSLMSKTC